MAAASARRRTGRSRRSCTASISARRACCGRSTSWCEPGCTSRATTTRALAHDVLESYLAGRSSTVPSRLWIGEGGITLVAWLLAPDAALADRLAEIVAAEPEDETLELMWGSPGLLLIADAMLERTGEERWASRVARDRRPAAAQAGCARPGSLDATALRVKTEGCSAPRTASRDRRRARSPARAARARAAVVPSATAALAASAIREGERVNWPPAFQDRWPSRTGRSARSGATARPASWLRSAALPREDELDALLLAGGELTWAAGPLRKGANLCHGTAGNGFALLEALHPHRRRALARSGAALRDASAAQVAAARDGYGCGRHRSGPAMSAPPSICSSASPAPPTCRRSISGGDGHRDAAADALRQPRDRGGAEPQAAV